VFGLRVPRRARSSQSLASVSSVGWSTVSDLDLLAGAPTPLPTFDGFAVVHVQSDSTTEPPLDDDPVLLVNVVADAVEVAMTEVDVSHDSFLVQFAGQDGSLEHLVLISQQTRAEAIAEVAVENERSNALTFVLGLDEGPSDVTVRLFLINLT
jgi:hypothetical protein